MRRQKKATLKIYEHAQPNFGMRIHYLPYKHCVVNCVYDRIEIIIHWNEANAILTVSESCILYLFCFYGQLVNIIFCLQHSVSSNQTAAAAAAVAALF